MKSFTYALLGMVMFVATAGAADKGVDLSELSDYNLVITGGRNGVVVYSGNSEGLSVSFEADEDTVTKIKFMCAFETRKEYIDRMAEVTKILYSKYFNNTEAIASNLRNSFGLIKESGNDDESFRIFNVRFYSKYVNGMIQTDVVPKKFLTRKSML